MRDRDIKNEEMKKEAKEPDKQEAKKQNEDSLSCSHSFIILPQMHLININQYYTLIYIITLQQSVSTAIYIFLTPRQSNIH